MTGAIAPSSYGPDEQAHRLEQYKLYAEMIDRIGQRRYATSSLFLAMHSLLLPALSALWALAPARPAAWIGITIAVTGGVLSYTWHALLRSQTNAVRIMYRSLHDMEERLPEKPYTNEERKLDSQDAAVDYTPMSRIEARVPLIFLTLYLALLVIQAGMLLARGAG